MGSRRWLSYCVIYRKKRCSEIGFGVVGAEWLIRDRCVHVSVSVSVSMCVSVSVSVCASVS